MPTRAPHPCNRPGCPVLTAERFCSDHKREHQRAVDAARGTTAERGYSGAWIATRNRVLAEESTCRACGRPGQRSDHVDHIKPKARGGTNDRVNLQRLCAPCHAVKTARQDGGFGRG